jgi:hypothetical protein
MGKTDLQDAYGTDVVLTHGRRIKDWCSFRVPTLLSLPVMEFLVVSPEAVAFPQFDEAEENILFLSELIRDRT